MLKVFPDNVPQQRLPPSIRADVSRMEQLSEEARFLATHKIKTFEELQEVKNSKKEGDSINIEFIRDGKTQNANVTLTPSQTVNN